MSALDQYKTILDAAKALVKAEEASLRAAETMRLSSAQRVIGKPAGRMGTLNARWSILAQERDRAKHRLHVAVVRAGIAAPYDDSYYGEQIFGDEIIVRERP